MPLRVTRPSAIIASASRREAMPARAITLAIRSSTGSACASSGLAPSAGAPALGSPRTDPSLSLARRAAVAHRARTERLVALRPARAERAVTGFGRGLDSPRGLKGRSPSGRVAKGFVAVAARAKRSPPSRGPRFGVGFRAGGTACRRSRAGRSLDRRGRARKACRRLRGARGRSSSPLARKGRSPPSRACGRAGRRKCGLGQERPGGRPLLDHRHCCRSCGA